MSAKKDKLTKTVVQAFKCPTDKRQAFFWCSETRGFGLRAMPDVLDSRGRLVREGTKAFVFQGRVKGTGQEVRDTIGRLGDPGVTVERMRALAEEYRIKLNAGINPAQAERDRIAAEAAAEQQSKADAEAAALKATADAELVRQRAVTLRDVADDYIAHKRTASRGPLRANTIRDINKHVDRSFAEWAALPVGEITPDLCLVRHRVLSKGGLTGERAAPAQAAQAFIVLRALLAWARKKYRVAGVPLVQGNPVEVLAGELHKPDARSEHIPPERIGQVFAALQARGGDAALQRSDRTGADLVMFQLLTGARPGEACALEWKRVHLEDDSGWWHMPKELSKNGKEFWLPLSAPARALLKARQRNSRSPWVFPARSGTGHMVDARGAVEHASAAAGLRLRPHDLRRSYIQLGISLGIELWKLELLTCHVNKGSVTVSNYVEKSRLHYLAPEQERIGGHIVQQAEIAAGRNVVSMKQRRRA